MNQAQAGDFSFLLPEKKRYLLERYGFAPGVDAWGVIKDGKPAGLGISSWRPGSELARIEYLSVAEGSRRQGIAAGLLSMLESELVAAGAPAVSIHYLGGGRLEAALRPLLARCNWPEPELAEIGCKTDTAHIMKANWAAGVIEFFGGRMDVFAWAELTDQERAELSVSAGAPPLVSPLGEFDADTSVGLRHDGRVMGWMITCMITPDTVMYHKLWVSPELQGQGYGPVLVAHAMQRHFTRLRQAPYAYWEVSIDNPQMMKFMKRKLLPYSLWRRNVNRSIKKLTH